MKFVGLWSLGTGSGKRSFTGTSLTEANSLANNIDFNATPGVYFTGQIQNLAPDVDVIFSLQSKGGVSSVRYTVHAREFIEFQNIPLERITVLLNGTATLQGIGAFHQLDAAELAGLRTENGLNVIQNAYIKVGKIDASGGGVSGGASWQNTDVEADPAAAADLVSITVGAGKKGYVIGVLITAPEANTFELNWTSGGGAKQKLFVISGAGGTIIWTDTHPLNAGDPADAGTTITIENVNAGSGNYQADILYAEEDA